MNKLFWSILLAAPALLRADGQWVLDQSTLTYHVSHMLHESEGVSHEARGKGVCRSGQCDFLIAVPVKSFISSDSNRDLHMIQVTRGAEFPIITVRTRLAEQVASASTLLADIDVEFAGHTAHYKQVPLERSTKGSQTHITGSLPLNLLDFMIDPPKLLTVAIKNEIPVRLDLYWHSQ
jgi:hypothetical protein